MPPAVQSPGAPHDNDVNPMSGTRVRAATPGTASTPPHTPFFSSIRNGAKKTFGGLKLKKSPAAVHDIADAQSRAPTNVSPPGFDEAAPRASTGAAHTPFVSVKIIGWEIDVAWSR